MFKKFILVLLMLGVCGNCWAVDATIYATDDSYFKEASATTNYATANPIQIGTWAAADRFNYVVKFDLSSLPASIDVTSAVISIMQGGADSSTSDIIRCYRLLRNWVEGEVTWNIYSTGNNWSTAGGAYSDSDRSSTESANATPNNTDFARTEWGSTAQLCTDIENFAAGTYSNYGWIFVQDYAVNTYHNFVSAEDGTASARPRLTITYTETATGYTSQVIIIGEE